MRLTARSLCVVVWCPFDGGPWPLEVSLEPATDTSFAANADDTTRATAPLGKNCLAAAHDVELVPWPLEGGTMM